MAKKTIRLSEKDFQKKLNEAVVKSVRKILKEEWEIPMSEQRWEKATSILGVKLMLNQLYDFLDKNDEIDDFLSNLNTDFDLGLFDDEAYEDKNEEEEDNSWANDLV